MFVQQGFFVSIVFVCDNDNHDDNNNDDGNDENDSDDYDLGLQAMFVQQGLCCHVSRGKGAAAEQT